MKATHLGILVLLCYLCSDSTAGSCNPQEITQLTLDTPAYLFLSKGLRADFHAKWPSGNLYSEEYMSMEIPYIREVTNVTTPPKKEDYSWPIVLQEYTPTTAGEACSVARGFDEVSLIGNATARRDWIATTIALPNGATAVITIARFNMTGELNVSGIAVPVLPDFAKITFELTGWPWQNRSSSVLMMGLDFIIRYKGEISFPAVGWLGNPAILAQRNFGLSFETQNGLKFDGVIQYWAKQDGVAKMIFIDSSPREPTMKSFEGAYEFPGTSIRARMELAMLPFDEMYWDPNLLLLLSGAEPLQSAPQDAAVQVAMQVGVSVSVVVVVVGASAALFLTRRRWMSVRARTARLTSKLELHEGGSNAVQEHRPATDSWTDGVPRT